MAGTYYLAYACPGRTLGSASAPFEELDLALVLLGRVERAESPQVLPLAGLGVLLPRVETVFAGLELSDHDATSGAGLWCRTSARSGMVVNAPTARSVQPTARRGLESSRSPSKRAMPAPRAARVLRCFWKSSGASLHYAQERDRS